MFVFLNLILFVLGMCLTVFNILCFRYVKERNQIVSQMQRTDSSVVLDVCWISFLKLHDTATPQNPNPRQSNRILCGRNTVKSVTNWKRQDMLDHMAHIVHTNCHRYWYLCINIWDAGYLYFLCFGETDQGPFKEASTNVNQNNKCFMGFW